MHANPMQGVNEMIKNVDSKTTLFSAEVITCLLISNMKAKILTQIWQRWQQIRLLKDGGM